MADINDLIKAKHDAYIAHRTLLESRRWDDSPDDRAALLARIMTAYADMRSADIAYKTERDRLVRTADV